jgi:glycogen synthase kinase 3 beta
MFRALAYLKGLNIVHRDIKPSNFLVDSSTLVFKLCDFGTAKILVKGKNTYINYTLYYKILT